MSEPVQRSVDAMAFDRINGGDLQPIIFIHGLWLLPSSWDPWIELFESKGYACIAPSWPGDLPSVDEANAALDRPSETLEEIVEVFVEIAGKLRRKPVLIGHSFGGLIAQLVADRGLAGATVAIAPAAFRGVLPLPFSALRSAAPVLHNPANRHHVVPLSLDQFQYAFGNALDVDEARALYERLAVPAPGGPLFEAAFANLNPWTDDKLDPERSSRGPLLLLAGEQDHVVPKVVVDAEYAIQRRNPSSTECRTVRGRGHSLVIDSGWRDVAEIVAEFITRSVAHAPVGVNGGPGAVSVDT